MGYDPMHPLSYPLPHVRYGQWSPLESILRKSANLNRWIAAVWTTAAWLGLIVLDFVTGPSLSLNSLYLLPLCLMTWCVGRVAGLGAGIITVVVTLYLNGFGDGLSAQASSVSTAVAGWNAGMRTFGVIFVIFLVGAFRRTFDRERATAQIDPLTGLGNRRSFRRESKRLQLAALRDDRILLCGIIDLDDFKAVNDQHGHAAGDDLLNIVARTLVSATRPYDVTARLGGDEFAFCLAVRDEAVAERKASEIHHTLIAAMKTSAGEPTCSLGSATGRIVDDTLEAADKAMYAAKRSGKSRWAFVKV